MFFTGAVEDATGALVVLEGHADTLPLISAAAKGIDVCITATSEWWTGRDKHVAFGTGAEPLKEYLRHNKDATILEAMAYVSVRDLTTNNRVFKIPRRWSGNEIPVEFYDGIRPDGRQPPSN